MMLSARYLILMMGLFSCYTGLIYNDIFSRAFEILPSQWVHESTFTNVNGTMVEHSVLVSKGAYAFGLDHAWHGATNQLLFFNSYKMKMAIVIGVLHMSFGIILNIYNHLHFNQAMNILTEFVPQLLFLECTFGNLSFFYENFS